MAREKKKTLFPTTLLIILYGIINIDYCLNCDEKASETAYR